ncbi:hypothetical protein CPB84DRAFT_1965683 [Gymnopilus junonius]|uniref:Uncharacterized protein n=1 Tax=Gymnopilus junonius TaxID=109634 RepID=A0A9P5NBZ9_GYMJU|nr:hypothetical protein CPB84DRAFT_1965683 [Gymnopilus junonius]
MLNAIPPPPRIESDDAMYFYGFTYESNVDLYRRIVDPSWDAASTAVPRATIARRELEKIIGVKMSLVEVYTDGDPPNALSMLAVASATKEKPESSRQVTKGQLMNIKNAGGFKGEARWLRSIWVIEDLQQMSNSDLV